MEGSTSQQEQLVHACSFLLQKAEAEAALLLAKDFSYYYEGPSDRLVSNLQNSDGIQQTQGIGQEISFGTAAANASPAGRSLTQRSPSFSKSQPTRRGLGDQDASSASPYNRQPEDPQSMLATPASHTSLAKPQMPQNSNVKFETPVAAATQATGVTASQGDSAQRKQQHMTAGGPLQSWAHMKQILDAMIANTRNVNGMHRMLARTQDAAVKSTLPRYQHLAQHPTMAGIRRAATPSCTRPLQQMPTGITAQPVETSSVTSPVQLVQQTSPVPIGITCGHTGVTQASACTTPSAPCSRGGGEQSDGGQSQGSDCASNRSDLGSPRADSSCSSTAHMEATAHKVGQHEQQEQLGFNSAASHASFPASGETLGKSRTSNSAGDDLPSDMAARQSATSGTCRQAAPNTLALPALRLGTQAELQCDAEPADDLQPDTPLAGRSSKATSSLVPKLALTKLAGTDVAASQRDGAVPKLKLGDVLAGVAKQSDQTCS